jgi:hypothetical protein
MRFDRILITSFNDCLYIDFTFNHDVNYFTVSLSGNFRRLIESSVENDAVIRIINQKQLFYEL